MLPKATTPWTLFEAAHLLNRAGFGGSPTDIKTFHALGREAAVESLVNPPDDTAQFPLPAWSTPEQAMAEMREQFEQRRESMRATRGLSPEEADRKRREARQQAQQLDRRRALEGQGWWFRRMHRTPAPLREKMTLFWHDHFATSVQKVRQPVLLIIQNELFRKHSLGSFKDLAHAIVVDPAMMLYLDTQTSKKGKPNENFAREVMELFTLGEGHYSEEDIREAARAFTGYSVNRFNGRVDHAPRQWDEGKKTIFGKTGNFKGDDVITLIFEQEQPSLFIARKIWEFFVYESPSESAVQALAQIVRKSDYQIAPLLREIFLSKEFYSESTIRNQIKSPVQFLISMLKQLEITEPPGGFPITAQQQLGQVLFMPPNVAGWDWGKAWINTNTLLTRYNLSGFLTKGSTEASTKAEEPDSMMMEMEKTPGMAPPPRNMGKNWRGPDYKKIAPAASRGNVEDLVDTLIFRFFQGPVPKLARESFIDYAKAKKGVIFTDKEVGELCHLMMSTPYYQLC
jgi:uncharacterized protein (DUF1800 family)